MSKAPSRSTLFSCAFGMPRFPILCHTAVQKRKGASNPMTDRPPGASREALWAAMEANGIAYPFAALPACPRWSFTRRPTSSGSLPTARRNYILGSRLDSQNLDARIQDVLAQLRPRVSRLHWLVLPVDQPSNLPQQLQAHGLRLHSGTPWMAAESRPRCRPTRPCPPACISSASRMSSSCRPGCGTPPLASRLTVEEAQPYYHAYACPGLRPRRRLPALHRLSG